MIDLLNTLLEPVSYPFMQRALLMGLVIGVVCAFLSCFMVLKGWSLMGDAISHAILPGIILSYVISIPLFIGAFIAGMLSTLFMGHLKRTTRLKEDSIIGIVFSVLFALGLFLFSLIETELHLTHILFGNILGINGEQMMLDIIILLVTFVLLLSNSRTLVLFCFDPIQLHMLGKSNKLYHISLLLILSIVIVISIQVVGILFVVALLITPGMFGYTLSHRFASMVTYAIVFTVFTIILGTLLSYYLDVATAPLIVVLQAIVMTCVLVMRKFQLNKIKPHNR